MKIVVDLDILKEQLKALRDNPSFTGTYVYSALLNVAAGSPCYSWASPLETKADEEDFPPLSTVYPMRLSQPKCPECGSPAIGTCDTIQGLARFDADPSEENVMFCGSTDVDWDSQRANRNASGGFEVACDNFHSWFTEITELEDLVLIDSPSLEITWEGESESQ